MQSSRHRSRSHFQTVTEMCFLNGNLTLNSKNRLQRPLKLEERREQNVGALHVNQSVCARILRERRESDLPCEVPKGNKRLALTGTCRRHRSGSEKSRRALRPREFACNTRDLFDPVLQSSFYIFYPYSSLRKALCTT